LNLGCLEQLPNWTELSAGQKFATSFAVKL